MPLKKIYAPRALSLLLLLSLGGDAAAINLRAQSPQRERRAAPAAPMQTPVAQPTPQATPAASPTPQASPTPTPLPVLALPAARTLDVLQARMREVAGSPQLAAAHFAAKIVSLDTGRVVYEENAGKLLMPASNMKIYTVAAALDRLGPDFRFSTSVYAQEKPDHSGKLKGDLVIYGRGDPTFAASFYNKDYYKAVDELAARVAAAGVKRVEGDLVGDESYFTGAPLGAGWEWDDLQWYYGAEVSALTVNDNALDLFVKPGVRAGDAALVTTGPATPTVRVVAPKPNEEAADSPNFITFVNRVVTAPRGAKRELTVYRPLGQGLIEVSGMIAEGDPGYTGAVAVPRPALLFASMLRAALERQGVTFKGRTRAVDARTRERLGQPFDASRLVEIARRESAPFSEIAARTMKPSQNLYTELILRTLGRQFPPADPNLKLTSAAAGHAVVRAFLREAGVEADRLTFFDGSGLARSNLISADATVRLLTHMSRHRHAQAWLSAQPVAGVDGTLRNRMRDSPAAGNVRAKTGTLNNVSALSGYVTSAAGERFVFSLIVNHYNDDTTPRTNFLDAVAVLLASFAGRT